MSLLFEQSFERMPEELLILIVYFLSTNSIGSFRAVCKKFNCVVIDRSLQLKRLSPYTLQNFYFYALNDGDSTVYTANALLENAYRLTNITSFSNISSWLTTDSNSLKTIDNIFLVVCRLCDINAVEWIVTNFDMKHLYKISIQIAICIKCLDLVKLLLKHSKFQASDFLEYRMFDTSVNFIDETLHLYLDYPSYISEPLILSWLIDYYKFTINEILDSGIVHEACLFGYISMIVWLSDHKFFDCEYLLETYISIAIENKHLEIAKILVQKYTKPRNLQLIQECLCSICFEIPPNIYVPGSTFLDVRPKLNRIEFFYNDIAKWLITHYNVIKEEITRDILIIFCKNDNLDMFEFIARKFYNRDDIMKLRWLCNSFCNDNFKIVRWAVLTYNITLDESGLRVIDMCRCDNAKMWIDLFNISRDEVVKPYNIDYMLIYYHLKPAMFILIHFKLITVNLIIYAANGSCSIELFKAIIEEANMQKSDFLTKCYECFEDRFDRRRLMYLIKHFDITTEERIAISLKLKNNKQVLNFLVYS